jgi:dTDP-glucose 4,6-dehydratase
METNKMKILVTGGAGFIGSNFILYWLKRYPGDEVVNFDALTYAGNLENLLSIADNSHYRFVKGNICNEQEVESVIDGVDVIVHFAAESHVDRSIMTPGTFVETNVKGTLVLLEVARKRKIRFHHVSTDEVFGSLEFGSKNRFTLSTGYHPNSPYSASKAGSDHLVRAYHETYGLPITITNCSNNYGPYQFPEKLIPLVITNLLEGKKIPVYGAGNQVRDWLYVDDHCQAIDLVLHNGKIGETYLVGGQTEDITNLEVVKKIIHLMGKTEESIEYVTDRPGHDVRYAVDWSRTQEELGYKPQFSFDEYLKKTIEWYIQNESWWKQVKSGEYQKYYEKQYKSA